MNLRLLPLRFLCFNTVGSAIFLTELVMVVVLTDLIGWWHMAAYAVGLVFSLIVNFFIHYYQTFEQHRETSHAFWLFLAVFISNMVVAWLLVYFLTHVLGVWYLFAILLTSLGLSIPLYLISKHVVFMPEASFWE